MLTMDGKLAPYAKLDEVSSDAEQKFSAKYQKDHRWTFLNKLPFRVSLFGNPVYTSNQLLIGHIGAYKSLSTSTYANGTRLNEQDVLYVKNEQGKLLMASYVLKDFWKTIAIGAVTYDPLPTGTNQFISGFNPDDGITGINIHNMFLFPVDVYYQGKLHARVHGYDNMGPSKMGGSKSVVYINNSWDGFRMGDVLTFKVNGTDTILYEVELIDQYQKDIYLGEINAE